MSKDASFLRFIFCAAVTAILSVLVLETAFTAEYRTPNFLIRNVNSDKLAKHFGDTAEKLRHDLAILWLGEPLPQWSAPCPILFKVGELGAGGQTSFVFSNETPFQGEVYGWEMKIQGSVEDLTTAVLPHEITHTIFASYFRCPLPRWLDEGGATTVENAEEQANYRRQLIHFLKTDRGIPFNNLVKMADYPADVMPLYAQGYSVVEYLIALKGHRNFVRFVTTGLLSENWGKSVQECYGIQNLGDLQLQWVAWVREGFPQIETSTLIADNMSSVSPIQQVEYHRPDEVPQPLSAVPQWKIGHPIEPISPVVSSSSPRSTPFNPYNFSDSASATAASAAAAHTSAHPSGQGIPISDNLTQFDTPQRF
ncbi:MAG: hypothetical protein LBQ54_08105 [Planctomycetaceae bacterium]|jgi:hypothetical protein|nr:hypothetical protein [Planctomycetaceae bacterium]